jgi:hypothetical protein
VSSCSANPSIPKSHNLEISQSHPSLRDLKMGAEAAAVVCLMLLLSPMSSKAHYVVVLLPSLFIARAVIERRSRWLSWLLVPLVICGPLTTKGLIGKSLGDLTLFCGLPTWYAILSLVGMWMVLAIVRSDAETSYRDMAGANVGRVAVIGSVVTAGSKTPLDGSVIGVIGLVVGVVGLAIGA